MNRDGKPITILMADDDPEDRLLAKEAMAEARLANDLRFVEDGEQLMDYLNHRDRYSDIADSPRPGLILLDLNMPKKDGREALKEIKIDPQLRGIPVVVPDQLQGREGYLPDLRPGRQLLHRQAGLLRRPGRSHEDS